MYTFPNHANIVFRGEYYNVERVQRSFTKRLLGLWSLSYTERLLRLNLDSLESRRVKADLVLLFKVIHGFVDIDRCAMFDIQIDRTTRGHDLHIHKNHSNVDARKFHFCNRVLLMYGTTVCLLIRFICRLLMLLRRRLHMLYFSFYGSH